MTKWTDETTGDDVITALGSSVAGKTIVITGPSVGGIGAAVAVALAKAKPAAVILLGRDQSKIAPVVDELKAAGADIKVTTGQLDLGSLASVRQAAEQVKGETKKVDLLINNAGIMAVKEFTKSPDGVELQLATNHIGHFLLTSMLLPELKAAGPDARVVNVGSQGYQLGAVRFDDYNFQDGAEYNRWVAYGQSKTAGILFTAGLAQKFGITSLTPHPGVVQESKLAINAAVDQAGWVEAYTMATKINNGNPPPPDMKSMAQATGRVLVAALEPELKANSGAFLVNNAPAEPLEHARGENNIDALWELSEKLVGTKFGS